MGPAWDAAGTGNGRGVRPERGEGGGEQGKEVGPLKGMEDVSCLDRGKTSIRCRSLQCHCPMSGVAGQDLMFF